VKEKGLSVENKLKNKNREWMMRAVLCSVPHRYFTKRFMYWLLGDLAQKDEAGRVILEKVN
jgi:hypothetical protein